MAESLMIKVCGITQKEQLKDLNTLPIAMVGLNFYPKSPRYISATNSLALQEHESFDRVGVFVNEEMNTIEHLVKEYALEYIQLHGDESPEFCRQTSKMGKVIKAFGLHKDFDFDILENYDGHVDLFLFDTRSDSYGGSGKKFEWTTLDKYSGSKPFFLSGGIKLSDIKEIVALENLGLIGIDINSGFEIAPGIKNMELITTLTEQLQ